MNSTTSNLIRGSARLQRASEGVSPSRTFRGQAAAWSRNAELQKFVSAECQNQHATSVPSPESRGGEQVMITRREFAKSLTGAAALITFSPVLGWAADETKV